MAAKSYKLMNFAMNSVTVKISGSYLELVEAKKIYA